MGLTDRIFGAGDAGDARRSGKDTYVILARDSRIGQMKDLPEEIADKHQRAEGRPPLDKESFQLQYGEHLEEGTEYICVRTTETGFKLTNPEWSLTVEGAPAEEDELAQELAAIREELREGSGGFMVEPDSIEEALIMRTAINEGDRKALEELKDLKDRESGGKTSHFEDADLDNQKEIVAAAFMNMMESYDSVGDAVEDVFSGVLRSADGTARVGPTADPGSSQQQEQQQAQQPEAGAEADPEPEAASSPAKEAFEEATQEAEEEEPERRLDLTADADRQSAGEMAEELGVSEEEQPAEGDETDQEAETDAEPVEAEADPGGMSAQPIGPEPEEEAEETVTEGEIVEESTVPAEPAVVERAASDGGEEEPERCQFVKDDGERCGNPAGEDGYCHVEGHGPDDEAEEPQGVEA